MIIKNKIDYHGTIGNIPVIVKISHDKYHPEEIKCLIILKNNTINERKSIEAFLNENYNNNLIIKPTDEFYDILELYPMGSYRFIGYEIEYDIYRYEFDIKKIPVENISRLDIQVNLNPDSIINKHKFQTNMWNGQIDVKYSYPEEIEFSSDIGKTEYSVVHRYEKNSLSNKEVTIQLKSPILYYQVDNPSEVIISKIKDELLNEVNDVCSVLSFCSRKQVRWYSIEFIIIDKFSRAHNPTICQVVHSKKYNDSNEKLISHENLINDGFNRIYKNYIESNLKESMERSITYLVLSYSDNYIEVNYYYCLISLECLCSNFEEISSPNLKFPSAKWRKIEAELRKMINSLLEHSDKETIDRIKNKLPELKSATLKDKIIFCSNELKINTEDLWRKEGFNIGLENAIRMRNILFHQAKCDDYSNLSKNLYILRILTERLLFKILDWPEDKIWPYYDNILKRLK